jgi:FlaA1/EpsC-like NDP-sugar epimerase
MVFFDAVIIIFTLLFSFYIRLGYWYFPEDDLLWIILTAPVIAIPIFFRFSLYNAVIRYIGFNALSSIAQAVALYALLWGVISFMVAVEGLPRSVILINCLLGIVLIGGSRIIARWIFSEYVDLENNNAIIYGAGSAGRQLANALSQAMEYKPIAFIDDSKELNKQFINGLRVYSSDSIESLITKHNVKEVLLALPSESRKRRNEIINALEPFPVMVRILPSITEVAQGIVKVNDLREISIFDLLGRDSVKPNQKLLDKNIRNKVVMVTGAGGSIGSELCRQIVQLGSSKLILFDHSELALYSINKELSELNKENEILPILGSVVNQQRLEFICKKFKVQTVYHAAAYKHVPMVESNTTEGVKNNVFGTLSCVQAAIKCKVDTFVLISTDKAVRPTNTMGASKRIAELILQSLSKEQKSTKLCMVRFGNVIGSSGSVIPLFNEQIRKGGPITVTDIDIIRYFMTIPESVELVIQAGAMGSEGDVFVLDMGEPIRINDLARKMINLSGLQVKDSENPDGDIEIKYTGLRSGEKLYEELLIGDNVSETENSMIMRAKEHMSNWRELNSNLSDLKNANENFNSKEVRELLIKIVPAFNPQSNIVDILND